MKENSSTVYVIEKSIQGLEPLLSIGAYFVNFSVYFCLSIKGKETHFTS